MTDIVKKVIVSGRVQGVFYRATTRAQARSLGLKGYAKNLTDGSVEVLVIGEAEAVNKLTQWLWIGSRACKVRNVTHVEAEDIDIASYSDFTSQ